MVLLWEAHSPVHTGVSGPLDLALQGMSCPLPRLVPSALHPPNPADFRSWQVTSSLGSCPRVFKVQYMQMAHDWDSAGLRTPFPIPSIPKVSSVFECTDALGKCPHLIPTWTRPLRPFSCWPVCSRLFGFLFLPSGKHVFH